jgi:hypothetical protein
MQAVDFATVDGFQVGRLWLLASEGSAFVLGDRQVAGHGVWSGVCMLRALRSVLRYWVSRLGFWAAE